MTQLDSTIPKQIAKNTLNTVFFSKDNQQIIQKQLHPSDVMDQVELLLSEKAKNITGEVVAIGGV